LNPARFRRRLLAWFDISKRDLPWRGNRDPYRIWVSEVMLQQTTVAAVVPYFSRFIRTFPNLKALAAADEQDVLHIWQGLGYYRRARNLHEAARIVTANGGLLTDDPAKWAELPGIGRYILGAVLSQAFDRPMPIVEANSIRVMCRLFGKRGDVKSSKIQAWLWETAEKLLPRKHAGDFNQAMMELGALICTPDNPHCKDCPVRADCKAFADGTQANIPPKAPRKHIQQVREVAIVVRNGKRVLLAQRPVDADRWRSMWEFPQSVVRDKETIEQAARRCLKVSLGLRAGAAKELTTIRYNVTQFQMTLTAVEFKCLAKPSTNHSYQRLAWVSSNQLDKYPASTAQRRIMEIVSAHSTNEPSTRL
jgi:A/G-specific adenine glycosylase